MARRQFRFVHASDFHLELPLHGVAHVPEHLRDLYLDAPFNAALRVFDTVVAERADFLLLSGDVANLRAAGPRALELLHSQFQRLHELNIAVYWADSGLDQTDHWPALVPLPPNVVTFSAEHVDCIAHRRGKETIATILGRRGVQDGFIDGGDFDEPTESFCIAVVHGAANEKSLNSDTVNYWALGGLHNRETLHAAGGIAYFCGSPQGRNPSEDGPHGCAVVEVDARGQAQRQTVATDIVRWQTEPIELPDHMDQQGLLRMLRDHCHRLRDIAGDRQLLVSWLLTDGDQLADTRSDLLVARLRQGNIGSEILATLRREFGSDVPGIWPVSLEAEPPAVLPAGWYEEDTVLGDLLRSVQHYQADPRQTLQLEPIASQCSLSEQVRTALMTVAASERESLLRQVSALGVDLLRGDRVLSEESPPAPASSSSPATNP